MAPPLPLLLLGALLVSSAARAPASNASAAPTVQVRLGVLLPGEPLRLPWALPRVMPALRLALEALQPQLSHDGFALRDAFASAEEEEEEHSGRCDQIATFLKAADMRCSHDPDVLLGLSCLSGGPSSIHFADFWQLPLLRAGLYSKDLGSTGEVYAGPLGPSLAAFQVHLFQHFNWTVRAVMIKSREMSCYAHYDLFWDAAGRPQLAPRSSTLYYLDVAYRETLVEVTSYIQGKGRVVFICLSVEKFHQIMHLAQAENMTNGDYVFFYLDPFGESLRAAGHREAHKPWQSKESNDTGGLREAFQTVVVITPHEPQTPEYRQFENQVVLRAQRDFGVAVNDSLGLLVSGCFHDGLLLYLRALNETLHEGGTRRNTSRILEKMRSLKFQGVTGMVSINRYNDREMDFDLWAMRDVETGEYQVVGHYIALEKRINWTGPILWKKGGPPLDNPPCVFDLDDPSCVNCECVQGRETCHS